MINEKTPPPEGLQPCPFCPGEVHSRGNGTMYHEGEQHGCLLGYCSFTEETWNRRAGTREAPAPASRAVDLAADLAEVADPKRERPSPCRKCQGPRNWSGSRAPFCPVCDIAGAPVASQWPSEGSPGYQEATTGATADPDIRRAEEMVITAARVMYGHRNNPEIGGAFDEAGLKLWYAVECLLDAKGVPRHAQGSAGEAPALEGAARESDLEAIAAALAIADRDTDAFSAAKAALARLRTQNQRGAA
jgi:hypothetical protein